jgi:hypothetical protein
MPPYPTLCSRPGCGNAARYKIAARWSDGATEELKTYALCCPACLDESFRRSLAKQAACSLAAGEVLEPPGIYQLERGSRDLKLARMKNLESAIAPISSPPPPGSLHE